MPSNNLVSKLVAGTAEMNVSPPLGAPLLGTIQRSEGVHDDLIARALVLNDGRRRVAIVCFDLIGMDPRLLLLAERADGAKFSMVNFIRDQPALCRVIVCKTDFPWLKRYAPLIRPNSVAQKEGVAGYELALNYNGLPFELIPRAASEIKGKSKYQLLSVNEAEQKKNPCRKLVTQKGSRWELTTRGENLLDLLTY